jgi:segregation and condensation protein B
MPSLAIQIEAILYLKGQALSLEDLAKLADCDVDAAAEGVIELMSNYARRDSALEVVENVDRSYALQLKESFKPLCDRLVPAEIGTGALRTLAAIALKGPISQSALVELRGGSAYQHVQELVEMGLVRKRSQAGNRSSFVLVTEKFKQTYELNGELQPYLGSAGVIVDDPEADFEEPQSVEDLETKVEANAEPDVSVDASVQAIDVPDESSIPVSTSPFNVPDEQEALPAAIQDRLNNSPEGKSTELAI